MEPNRAGMRNLILFCALSLASLAGCQQGGKVTIVKQWHLSPGQNTTAVESSKSLPQYQNQRAIYELLEKRLAKGDVTMVAEGCEGEINSSFAPVFNGWSLDALRKRARSAEFSSIMAPVGMKLEAKFPERARVLCGDNIADIEANKLAMSDLRGYAGFFQRLVSAKNHPEKFEAYKKSLEEIGKQQISDPIGYSRDKALSALKLSKELIEKRNHAFLEVSRAHLGENPIIVIGGIHAQHLGELLEKEGIDYEIVTPEGYSEHDQELYSLLEKSLSLYGGKLEVVWLQVPEGFSAAQIPLKNFLDKEKIATPKEWQELSSLMKEAGLDERILLSDFDGDGVRDFTASTGGGKLFLSAEDDDWDADGVANLLDSSWGSAAFDIQKASTRKVTNLFNLQGVDAQKILGKLSAMKIAMLETDTKRYDVLLLKVILDVLSKTNLTNEQVRAFRIATPKLRYGKQVYFAYNPASLSVDIYWKDLIEHYQLVRKKGYSESSDEQVVRGYLLPLLYHSIAHELVHAMGLPERELARKDGWTFNEQKYHGKYLLSSRLARKVITDVLQEERYKGKDYQQWGSVKKPPGFLFQEKIPSLYALSKPTEWIAEKVAMCFLRLNYPDSGEKQIALQYEALLGINPASVDQEFCSAYFTGQK